MGGPFGGGSVFEPAGGGGVGLADNNVWTGLNTFDGSILIPVGDEIRFVDNQATIEHSAGEIRFKTFGVANRLTVGAAVASRGLFSCGSFGGMDGNNKTFSDMGDIRDVNEFRMDEIARPGAVVDHGQMYTRDIGGTAEVHVQDAAGNETQISAHDKNGKYVIRTSNIKNFKKLEIQMEKFMVENYPEYVVNNNIQMREKIEILSNGGTKITKTFKWYQIIKKRKEKKKNDRRKLGI